MKPKFYYSEEYKSVFRSDVNQFIPTDAVEISEDDFKNFINDL